MVIPMPYQEIKERSKTKDSLEGIYSKAVLKRTQVDKPEEKVVDLPEEEIVEEVVEPTDEKLDEDI